MPTAPERPVPTLLRFCIAAVAKHLLTAPVELLTEGEIVCNHASTQAATTAEVHHHLAEISQLPETEIARRTYRR